MTERETELALSSFSYFTWLTTRRVLAKHQLEWYDAIIRAKRLAIIAPPAHGKTLVASVLYPAFCIARDPTIRIIIVCATFESARERSNAVRNIVFGEKYQALFPHVRPGRVIRQTTWDVIAADRVDPFPTMTAVGVGSHALIGRRADLIILDDAMSEAQARSNSIRAMLASWARHTLLTRLSDRPDSKVVSIATRWHEADLTGALLDAGFDIHHSTATPERPLWPERLGRTYLEAVRTEIGSAAFRCMYEGDPSGIEGLLIKRDWLQPVDDFPQMRYLVVGVDLATTTKTSSDFTALALMGVGEDGRYYLLGIDRFQAEWPAARRRIIEFCTNLDNVAVLGVEAVAFQNAAVQDLRSVLGPSIEVRGVQVSSDKYTRALAWVPFLESGNMRVGRLNRMVLDELVGFPRATHDDCVDAVSIAFACVKQRAKLEVY